MKSLKIILSIGILFLAVAPAKSQNCDNSKDRVKPEARHLNVIEEEDYPNFWTLDGLKNYSNVRYETDIPLKHQSYTLKGDGQNIEMYAHYGKDGKLAKGKLVIKNKLLPKNISVLLIDSYKGWEMKANKTIVENFDANTTRYEVKMERDNKKMTLHFDHLGNPLDQQIVFADAQ